jgi:hypothetical protein
MPVEINSFEFLIITLAIWRITHLLQAEDGPWDIIFKLRKAMGNSMWGSLMDCFYCLSIWISLPFGLFFGTSWLQRFILWFAFSGASILLQKITSRDNLI